MLQEQHKQFYFNTVQQRKPRAKKRVLKQVDLNIKENWEKQLRYA
jgi:hypothetical protein